MTTLEISMSFKNNGSANRSAKFATKVLPLAVGLLVSATASAGFPTLYGKIYLTASQYDLEKNNFALTAPGATTYKHIGATGTTPELDTSAIESTGSRLGVQGDFGAANDLTVFYRIEYGIDVDNGTNSNGRELTQRNIFGGVRGDWGQVLVGKNDTPLKTLQTNSVLKTDIDQFNDAPLADIGTYLVGENRPDNVIQYTSPILLGGLEINFAAIQSEETGIYESAAKPQNDEGFAAGKSLSVVYGKAKWYVGAAYETNVLTTDAFRAVGEVTLGPVKLGAIYQKAERHEAIDSLQAFSTFVGTTGTTLGAQNGLTLLSEWDGAAGNAFKEQDGYVLNANWKIAGPWTAKVQVGSSSTTPTNAAYKDVKADAVAVGLDYKLSDAARLFTYYASVKAEGDKKISTEATEDKTFALGLDFKF
jgi:predicted porin